MDSGKTSRHIDSNTALYGVVGRPLAHTLGPRMHNAAFAAMGLNALYLAFETRDIAGAVTGARALNLQGLSVTLPYKTSVMELLDQVDEMARKIGAVNTIARRGDLLVGFNTDAHGVLKALETCLDPGALRGMPCLIVGAGGAARALGFTLAREEATLAVSNRSRERGERLAKELGCPFLAEQEAWEFGADLLVNATPVGMNPLADTCPVPDHVLRKGLVVMDLVYNPRDTLLLQKARARGCRTVSGLDMFIFQGAEQFRLWTGLEPPLEVMKTAVLEAIKS